MLNDQQLKKEREYGAKALAYCQMTADQKEARQVIRPGMAEWSSWERYFVDHLGFTPIGMKLVVWGRSQGMTVPAQWPEWFDNEYAKRQAA
jgi:hypothetical protein